eukprot:5517540-Pyramimonas_sp.AAC.1
MCIRDSKGSASCGSASSDSEWRTDSSGAAGRSRLQRRTEAWRLVVSRAMHPQRSGRSPVAVRSQSGRSRTVTASSHRAASATAGRTSTASPHLRRQGRAPVKNGVPKSTFGSRRPSI